MLLLDKWIKSVQNGTVGLDVGSGAVKLVSLSAAASGWTASGAAWSDVASSEDAPCGDHAAALEAVRGCVQAAPSLSMRRVVCGLSGPSASVRGFSFPAMPDDAVEQAVRLEAQQVCPMELNHSVLDFQLMQSDQQASSKQSGVLVAGIDQAIVERCKLVKEAGGRIALMDADGLAALNCLTELEDLDHFQTVALLDIGQRYTNVIMLGPNGLPFVRDIDNGGAALTAQIAEATGQTIEQVQAALWRESDAAMPGALLAALHQAARPLLLSINETLKFYATQEKCPFVEKVYLCGGTTLVRPLVELLIDALPTTVELFDPFKKIRFDDDIDGADLLRTRGPALVVAAGLAMRTV